jgi:hypothetical protein
MAKRKTKRNTMRRTMRTKRGGNPKIYYSSSAIKAVSNDGGKQWHVDVNINGEKRHANLSKHDIMDVLSYPASKKDLRTRLLEDFNMHGMERGYEGDEMRNERNERKVRNVRKMINTRKNRK